MVAMRRYTLSLLFLGAVLAGCGGSGGPVASTVPSDGIDRSGGIEDNAWLKGASSNINLTAKTFTIKTSSGTFTLGSLVNVKTTTGTRFRLADGTTVSGTTWFSRLTTGRRVEAEGAKGAGNTLTATKVKMEKD